ncbi:hypothetical protein GWK08_01380 [Leptobacterium flavescens]|uniref:Activator of Hsp90 ATPase homologue 1/2-like C-terminal domain-containing protein n=1 Tax=Leptobacterium flavescens TaxID=472055 RepID=A0A6P0UI06_9FLAO|nr:SRPBCC family protein [Leptobacterium flavescens]NER12080.1 hypothetical protein [Leptobacterium flavescens]
MKKVEVNISIKTSPERVISAFTDLDMLKDWWVVERALVQKREGGIYTLAWNISETGFGYVSSGLIEKYDPQKELVIGNLVYMNPERPFLGPMTLSLRAVEKNGESDVYLCQSGYQEGEHWNWYYQAVKDAWPVVMESFKKYLEQ